jgi:hypothetical protein
VCVCAFSLRRESPNMILGDKPLIFEVVLSQRTRLLQAHGPVLVDFELRGIPAHAWEKSTMQQLLGWRCWVGSFHPDTVQQRDLSMFRASAWCSHPDLIPKAVDLLIPDPAPPEAESLPVKHGLIYPIELSLLAKTETRGGSSGTLCGPDYGRHYGGVVGHHCPALLLQDLCMLRWAQPRGCLCMHD